MTIPWIHCTDRMPPDDETYYITKVGLNDMNPGMVKGKVINSEVKKWSWVKEPVETYWIAYDEATWKGLTNE